MPDDVKQFTEKDLEDTAFKVSVLTQLERLKPIEEKLITMNGRCAERLEMIHGNEISMTQLDGKVDSLNDNVKFWRKVVFIILGFIGTLSAGIGGVLAYMKAANGG